jgi:diacylglycerol kinase family enzyme
MIRERGRFQDKISQGNAVLLFNPEAGMGSIDKKWHKVRRAEKRLKHHGWDVDINV